MLSKKYQLEVKPLCIDDFDRIEPIFCQIADHTQMQAFFRKHGMPPHQATFYDVYGNIVLLAGFVEYEVGKFEAWTVFGTPWKVRYYLEAKAWVDHYLTLLEFEEVSHIISNDRPWMEKVMEYLGFRPERLWNKGVEWVRSH